MKWIATLVGLASVGVIVSGVLGLAFGVTALLMGDTVGGGTCLIAAALAFGLAMRAVLTP